MLYSRNLEAGQFIIEQGETAEREFNTVDRRIDNITTTVVFSYYRLNLYRDIAKKQQQTNCNFMFLYGRDLRPPNFEVVPARRGFRHAGMHVMWYLCISEH